MREFVALMYVVGAVVTAGGVFLAFHRARRDLRLLEGVAAVRESQGEDVDLVETLEDTLEGRDDRVTERRARREADQEKLNDAVGATGFLEGRPPTYADLRLPLEYWAKRSALRDAVASFRSGGLVALTGLAISTVASVWSLYLPTG